MRINCGPTLAERRVRKERRLEQWHSWFAWRPIRIGTNECVWLESSARADPTCLTEALCTTGITVLGRISK